MALATRGRAMGEPAQTAEQRFAHCRELIARQRAICDERAATTIANAQWCALTEEFGALQVEINKLLGGTT
jgi:hypothetical protein